MNAWMFLQVFAAAEIFKKTKMFVSFCFCLVFYGFRWIGFYRNVFWRKIQTWLLKLIHSLLSIFILKPLNYLNWYFSTCKKNDISLLFKVILNIVIVTVCFWIIYCNFWWYFLTLNSLFAINLNLINIYIYR